MENLEEKKFNESLKKLNKEISTSKELLNLPLPIIEVRENRTLRNFINLLTKEKAYNIKG
jgi:hypothetical protein